MAKAYKLDLKQTWQTCNFCSLQTFKSSNEFVRHLRDRHCTREGGSFVCRYGYKGVCASLPLDGVSDRDYESHVLKYHVNQAKGPAEEWSVFLSAQNLPAVLNDPNRGKQSNIFTKKWGDSFVEKVNIPPSPLLPDITYDHLDTYVKHIGKRYRRHLRLNQNIQQRELLGQSGGGGAEHSTSSSPTPSETNAATTTTTITNNNSTISTSHKLIYNELDDANFEDIPPIFTKPNLDFNNIDTFEAVFPGVCDSSSQSGRLLQEKLSHYLDIVEVQIARQVSERSSSFFHAMTSQDAIMEEMQKATKNVVTLRQQMRMLDETMVKKALQVLTIERSRTNYRKVLEKLKLMATVHQTQPMIQLLLGTQDYVAALDLISTTQEIVAQELIGIHCFKHLPSQLTEIERLIDKMLATDFEKYSTVNLNQPLIETMNADRVLEEDKLICIISGLLRQKNFSFIDAYKDEAIITVRTLIKQMVIEVIATSDEDRSCTGPGESAQCLTISEWVALLGRATVILLRLLKRVKAVLSVMHQISETSSGRGTINGSSEIDDLFDAETFLTEADHLKVEEKLNDVMHSVCNYCHERCANLISSQSLERHVATAEEIHTLAQVVGNFSRGCEELSGTQRIPLTAALQAQAMRFSQKFHAERKSKLSLLLDSERWKQADVPAEYQQMIDKIANGDFTWTKNDDNGEIKSPKTVLLVDLEPFALVGAALLLIQIVNEYCQCASHLPIIATQLSRHLIDLLRTFNSKCCQLVLGAGAIRVAGLTTITTGNLALVSRALQLVIWLLPRVKAHYQKIEQTSAAIATATGPGMTSSTGSATTTNSNSIFISTGYDTVEKDFSSHIKEIDAKVLTIVSSLVDSQLSNWTARPPVPSQSFRNISRHFVKLHEVLAPILPERQIHHLYRTVQKNFKDKLRELLQKYNIINNGGPQHGVVTSELTFYMETLRTLKAMPDEELQDDTLNDIWLK